MAPATSTLPRTEAVDPIAQLAPGAPAVVLTHDGETVALGELSLWSAGSLVVTARIDVAPGSARALLGRRIFARINSHGTLIVLQALARPVPSHSTEVELVGVRPLAVETRRTALRANLVREVLLLPDDAPAATTFTLDLSTGGCRVEVPHGTHLAVGDRIATVLTDSDGGQLLLRAEVIRVSPQDSTAQQHAALRFIDISSDATNRIDREVLAWHTQQ